LREIGEEIEKMKGITILKTKELRDNQGGTRKREVSGKKD